MNNTSENALKGGEGLGGEKKKVFTHVGEECRNDTFELGAPKSEIQHFPEWGRSGWF